VIEYNGNCFVSSEEYVAHAGDVRSLCLGRSSRRLLVTGGEDNEINMWSLDKPNCLLVSSSDTVLLTDFCTFHTCLIMMVISLMCK